MAKLSIPERFKPGFVVLAALPEPSFQEFLRSVKAAPDTFTRPEDLQTRVASEVKVVPPGDSAKIIESIFSALRFFSKSSGWTIPKLVVALDEAARTGIDNFKTADGTNFSERLATLLNVESFNSVSIKARELQAEAERTFVDARILTDIRPIFGDEIEGNPAALIVVHTLKIVTHEGASHKEFYVALDADDIESLRKVLSRAEEKARRLKSLIDASGLRSIDLSSQE